MVLFTRGALKQSGREVHVWMRVFANGSAWLVIVNGSVGVWAGWELYGRHSPQYPSANLPLIAPSIHSDSHQQAARTGPCLQVWPCYPLPGTTLAPPYCKASIGCRQAISPQLCTDLGHRKWLTHALRAGVSALCLSLMVLRAGLLHFNTLISCGMSFNCSLPSRD